MQRRSPTSNAICLWLHDSSQRLLFTYTQNSCCVQACACIIVFAIRLVSYTIKLTWKRCKCRFCWRKGGWFSTNKERRIWTSGIKPWWSDSAKNCCSFTVADWNAFFRHGLYQREAVLVKWMEWDNPLAAHVLRDCTHHCRWCGICSPFSAVATVANTSTDLSPYLFLKSPGLVQMRA